MFRVRVLRRDTAGGREGVSAPDIPTLTAALRAVCQDFGAAAASASYVSPLEGRLVELHVTAHGLAWLEDQDGHAAAIPQGARE